MNDEELDAALSGLPETDLDPARAEAMKATALRAMNPPAHQPTSQPFDQRVSVRSFYGRVVEPTIVLALCAVQLVWVADALTRVFAH